MIRLFAIIPLLFLITIIPAYAQTETATGILPDSFLWRIDVAIDNLRYQLADDVDRPQTGLEIAHERLLETRAMMDQNKFDRSEASQVEHDNIIDKVEMDVDKINTANGNGTNEQKLRDISAINTRLEIHKLKIEQLKSHFATSSNPQAQRIIDNLDAHLVKLESKVESKKTLIEFRYIENDKATETKIRQIIDNSGNQIRDKFKQDHDDVDRIISDVCRPTSAGSGEECKKLSQEISN